MNDQFFKKIASDTKLEVAEREHIAYVLSEYTKINPIRESAPSVAVASSFALFGFRSVFAGSLIAILAITSGVSYAAEGALPGDTLYNFKVSVLEEARGALTLSEESKADWEATRAERRLEEAQILAVEGKLNAETKTVIENNFNEHATRVEERIASFKETGDEDKAEFLSTRFEASLSAHEAVLSKLAVEDGEETKQIAADIRAKVKKATLAEIASSGNIENTIALKSAAPVEDTFAMMASSEGVEPVNEGASEPLTLTSPAPEDNNSSRSRGEREIRTVIVEKQNVAANREILAVETLLKSPDSFKSQVYSRAKSQLQKAKDLFKKGEEALKSAKNNEAFNFFKESYKIAYELRVYLGAKNKLNLDITPLIVNPDTADDSDSTEPFSVSGDSNLEKLSKEALESAKKKLNEKIKRNEGVLKEAIATVKNAEYLYNRGMEALEDKEDGSANRYFNASFTESLKAGALLDIRGEVSGNATTTDGVKTDDSNSEEFEKENEVEDSKEEDEGEDRRGSIRSFLGI